VTKNLSSIIQNYRHHSDWGSENQNRNNSLKHQDHETKMQVTTNELRKGTYFYENNQQDALYRLTYYSKSALNVSGDVSAHHQEHLTVFTVCGSVHPSCCRLVSWMS
jgi:hypothetical protein